MERFYGYGIVDKDGKGTTLSFNDKYSADKILDQVDAALINGPFRVVSLYYKDEQS